MKEFKYRGKAVKIKTDRSKKKATITIDGKRFEVERHQHGKPEDNYIKLWMCPAAYSMTETPEAMARHIVEYWYQFEKLDADTVAGHSDHGDHGHNDDHGGH